MLSQIVWPRGCKVTLVAFFWLFSILRLQTSPQFASVWECIVTLIAFVCLCVFKWPTWEESKSHWLHLFDFSPMCVFKCLLNSHASEDAKSHWLHWFYFSPLCVFKCVLKWPAWQEAKLHWLHLFDFSPLCVFKCLLKMPAWEDA